MITCLIFFNFIIQHVRSNFILATLVFVALFQLSAIGLRGFKVKFRYDQLYRALDYTADFPNGKYSFRASNYYTYKYGHDWVMPNESLLISSLSGKSGSRQVFIKEAIDRNIYNTLKDNSFLYASWWNKSMSDLNSNYFDLSDTGLVEVNTDIEQMNLSEENLKNVKIKFISEEPRKIGSGKELFALIELENQREKPLYSGMNADGISLAVKFVSTDGKIELSERYTPLIADVHTSLRQHLAIKGPKPVGDYTWEVGLKFNNNRFISLYQSQTTLTVN